MYYNRLTFSAGKLKLSCQWFTQPRDSVAEGRGEDRGEWSPETGLCLLLQGETGFLFFNKSEQVHIATYIPQIITPPERPHPSSRSGTGF